MYEHPLEHHGQQRAYFERTKGAAAGAGVAAWRQAVVACTGFLPTWARKGKPGPGPITVKGD